MKFLSSIFRYVFILSLVFTFTKTLSAQTYTLTNSDVVVNMGFIESCSYNFALTDIIIPNVLDGQTVVGVGHYVFSNKGITSIELPTSIGFIGQYAFSNNNLTELNLIGLSNLVEIDEFAFYQNPIADIDWSDCSSLVIIDQSAFCYNSLTELDMTGCVSLHTINFNSFQYNSLTTVRLDGCTSLVNVSTLAFDSNLIDTLYLPPNPSMYGPGIFNDNLINYINGSPSDGFIYNLPSANYADSSIVLSYGGANKDPIIPQNVTVVGYWSFNDCGIESVDFSQCVDLEIIAIRSLENNSIDVVNLSNCHVLKKIFSDAFTINSIDSLNLSNCDSLEFIGESAFKNNLLPSIDLTECISLKYIGAEAFSQNPMTSFALPIPVIPDSTLVGWEDTYGVMHAGGETVTDLITYYDAVFVETIYYGVTFTVTDGTNPIEHATVSLSGYGDQLTDASGMAIFAAVAPEADINYSVAALGYDIYIDSITVVDTDVSESVTLSLTTYNVIFNVSDGTNPIENANVSLTGYGDQTTDVTGNAVFSDVVPETDIPYGVFGAGYVEYNGFVSVVDAVVSESVVLVPSVTTYQVTFVVAEGIMPIQGANVNLTGYGVLVTDDEGKVLFEEVSPGNDIPYSVVATGYHTLEDFVTVAEDVEENVDLMQLTYRVTFEVFDQSNPLADASVSLVNYGTQLTDASGKAYFDGVYSGLQEYWISASYFFDAMGELLVEDEDVYQPVLMIPTEITQEENPDITIYPNPATDQLFIQNAMHVAVTIYSNDGVMCYSNKNCSSQSECIDVTDYEAGLYYIKINEELFTIVVVK